MYLLTYLTMYLIYIYICINDRVIYYVNFMQRRVYFSYKRPEFML